MTETKNTIPLDHYEFVAIEDASTPINGIVMCILDAWWSVDGQGRIAFYYGGRKDRSGGGSPQCNGNEQIVRKVSEKDPWAVDVVQIPAVFRRINMSEYQY